jgi:hypothetical protein
MHSAAAARKNPVLLLHWAVKSIEGVNFDTQAFSLELHSELIHIVAVLTVCLRK